MKKNQANTVTRLRGNRARYAVVMAAMAPDAPTRWSDSGFMAAQPQAAKTPPDK